jgi:protein gp37
MADRTKIEWTDATWNPIRGCTRVSEGCRNCYAEVMAARFSDPGQWGHGLAQRVALPGGGTDHRWTGKVELVDAALDLPLRWRSPRRIFVNSTSDLFHEKVPDEWIDMVFAVMAVAPQHTFQVLTKRPDRMQRYLSGAAQRRIVGLYADRLAARGRGEIRSTTLFDIACDRIGLVAEFPDADIVSRLRDRPLRAGWPLPNVWLGTSIEDQATADDRIPHLLATPAAVRFISAEPLLGPVDLTGIAIPRPDLRASVILDVLNGTGGLVRGGPGRIDWVICGGESGPGARPMHPDWARSLRDQCQAAGVPFFFKQQGKWLHESQDPYGYWDWSYAEDRGILHSWPDKTDSIPLRGKSAGHLLDGREWNEVPNG